MSGGTAKPRVGRYRNPATVLFWDEPLPPGASVEPVALATDDRSAITANLYTVAGARTVVWLMHPRVDVTHHYLVPLLLERGVAVFTQRSRFVNNDAGLVHERVLLDVAAGQRFLRSRGFEDVILLGNSGGSSLACLYAAQANQQPADRLTDDPAGSRIDLTGEMPPPDGMVLLAPHPGQGDLLLHCIDPSVTDEADAGSLDPGLHLYNPANGFASPPESSRYSPEFLDRYRAGQRNRVTRIDEIARGMLARRRTWAASGDAADRARAAAVTYVVVHRTDADPRSVDLSLDPSGRDYGSIFGVRPDITNQGAVGFGRLCSPEAWLSTWSAHSTRAAIRLTAPAIHQPVFLIGYSADNTVFPGDLDAITTAFTATTVSRTEVEGDHYGLSPDHTSRPGGKAVADLVADWVAAR
jgi:hypothetical protein